MKKLIFKCVVMTVAFIGATNYMMYVTTGKSPLSTLKLPSWKNPVETVSLPSLDSVVPSGGKQTVYKWVDEHGVTQYSADPPPEHIQAKSLELDPETNIIQSLKMPEAEEAPAPSPQDVALPGGNVYSPDAIKKLMDDAQNVQKLLNERNESQQKALDQL